jgi:hypothetical protein
MELVTWLVSQCSCFETPCSIQDKVTHFTLFIVEATKWVMVTHGLPKNTTTEIGFTSSVSGEVSCFPIKLSRHQRKISRNMKEICRLTC